MTTGESLLAIGAIALFMLTAVNVNRTYVSAAAESLRQQRDSDMINYAQSLTEMVYANGVNYDTIEALFLNASDIANPARRLTYVTSIGDSLFATVLFSAETAMIQGFVGKIATIQVYSREMGDLVPRARNTAAIIRQD